MYVRDADHCNSQVKSALEDATGMLDLNGRELDLAVADVVAIDGLDLNGREVNLVVADVVAIGEFGKRVKLGSTG